jgi:hypothetical protein
VVEFHFYKRKPLIAVTLGGLIILFFVFVYPRPFKQPDLRHFSRAVLQNSDLDFSYVGFWNGCEIEVHPTEITEASSFGLLPPELEARFSPWISSLDGILYQEAYFYTLDFNECYRAFVQEYQSIDLRSIVFNGASDTMLRVGGIAEYSVPLSHANTLLIFTLISGQQKLIILKGGG